MATGTLSAARDHRVEHVERTTASVRAEAVASALEATVRIRAPRVAASTEMVCQLVARVAHRLGFDAETRSKLLIATRVRDAGLVALPDSVVLANGPLSPEGWKLLSRHPILGSELLQTLPDVRFAADIVRSHHERWDGGGYPEGRQGDAIPLGSRVIAACDSFVAIATDRPYRRGVGVEAALEVVRQDDGQQFDPEVVDALVSVITGEHVARRPRAVAVETLRSAEASMPAPRLPADSGQRAESGPAGNGGSRRHGGHDLRIAISDLDVLPALAPASERLLTLLEGENATESELTNAIETDGGLTVAILKEAQALSGRRPITNVADAVAALDRSQIRSAVAGLPRAAFPWGASRRQSLLHRIRVHALIVARSAQRIAREVGFQDVDELVVVALLHDVGKLVLARAFPDYDALVEPRTTTPEERLRQEQRSFRLDHASIGGLLIGRWGLPARIGNAVSAHHSCEQPGELAAFVRLADMATHHALGEVIDRSTLMHLAEVCGLSVAALRDVLFDLPRADGSRRRRADPSPLSPRESDAIRLLAQGKVYTAIAADLDLAPSTVRSHLHKAYQKLGVVDRAQAVLRATEMGWI